MSMDFDRLAIMEEEEGQVAVMVEETYERLDNVRIFEFNVVYLQQKKYSVFTEELVHFVVISYVLIYRRESWLRKRSLIWRDSQG